MTSPIMSWLILRTAAGTAAFALLISALWLSPSPARPQEWDVTARSFVIMDAKTGKTLLSLNPHLMLPPASTLKVMTAMFVLEKLKMEDRVPVSAYAAAAPASKINIQPGDSYSVKELLYALLLSSANDGARALAERVSGTEEAFARELTRQVREWGAYRPTLANANGLPSEHQYSTAEDLAILFRSEDLPSPAVAPGKGAGELDTLDRKLNDSLSSFDQMLLKEMDDIRLQSEGRMKDAGPGSCLCSRAHRRER